jgi:hypothetical protein
MLNITNEIEINSNDYILSVKTLFEEIILYGRGQNLLTKASFNGLEMTEFAGLNYAFANYNEIKKTKPNLETLLGFSLNIPTNFDLQCNQKIELGIVLRSEWCSDIILKQNKIFDTLRYILTYQDFFWDGEVATNINLTNTQNTDISKYRINHFEEINQSKWIQSQSQDNYIISQQFYTFLIHKN